MKTTIKMKTAMTLALGTALLTAGSASAVGKPFELQPIAGGSMHLAEGKCGGNKEAAGKCGGAKSDHPQKSISVLEGKCGQGKCGSARIRQMMDNDGNGRIDREEYVGWSTRQAGAEFDSMAHGAHDVSPEDAFQNFLRFEANAAKG